MAAKKKAPKKVHLLLRNFRSRPPIFQLTMERWAASAKRHKALAKHVKVTYSLDDDTLEAALPTVDAIISNNPPRENLAERAPNLRWIQNTGAGVDALMPMDWMPANVTLTNNSGAHGEKCEEYCLMAFTMLAFGFQKMIANQQAHKWEQFFYASSKGKTAVVVGFGDLGMAAGRAAKKLGMTVIGVTRSGKAGKPADKALKIAKLDSVLAKADYVVVATPSTPETKNIMSRERLAMLKPSAGLINVGRAPLVDYSAMCEMLKAGTLAGAVVDVLQPEPQPADSAIWDVPNLLITPHISCDYPDYVEKIFDRWFENLPRFMKGQPLKYTVDRKLGY
ncbi:MAG: D-2-hydroxyacid dehydrogenase [Burkholderiales bacterium]